MPAPATTTESEYLGVLELRNGEYFEIFALPDRLVFGGAANAVFLESGHLDIEDGESVDEALTELKDDLEVYYADGPQYVSRIVCNECM